MGGSYGDRTRPPTASVLGAFGLLLVAAAGGLPGTRLLNLRRQLLELLGERRTEALHRRTLSVAGQVELLGEVLLGELLDRRLRRLHRLDLQRAVVLEAGRGGDQLPNDHVLLQPHQPVALALQG